MKKKIIICFILISIFLISSFACTNAVTDITQIVNPTPTPVGDDKANAIIGAMQWIGYAIAIGMMVFIGIKYVVASADEKADLKNALVKYLIGAILIALAATIAGWIFNLTK